MKKIICLAVCMVCMVAATGCGKKSLVNTEPPKENVSESVEESGEDVWVEEKEDVDLDSYKDGKWQERSCGGTNPDYADYSSSEEICDVHLGITVYEKLSDEEIMGILEYYWEEKFDEGDDYQGCKVNSIFAVFYDKDTYDVLETVKYGSEGKMDITEEDEIWFNTIISSSRVHDDDTGLEE